MLNFTGALIISAEAHDGVLDKCGDEYIKHPLHLAYKLKSLGYSKAYQIVALLHDVVEDTKWTIKMLRAKQASEEVLEAVELMTHIVDKDLIMEYLILTFGNKKLESYSDEEIEKAI